MEEKLSNQNDEINELKNSLKEKEKEYDLQILKIKEMFENETSKMKKRYEFQLENVEISYSKKLKI